MKQCPECDRWYPDYTSACKCGHAFPTAVQVESKAETSDGSLILVMCAVVAAIGIVVSIGYGIYLIVHKHPVIGIVSGTIGAVYHAGLMIVFSEVNRIIEARKAAQRRAREVPSA
jgi:hypothetical protein